MYQIVCSFAFDGYLNRYMAAFYTVSYVVSAQSMLIPPVQEQLNPLPITIAVKVSFVSLQQSDLLNE